MRNWEERCTAWIVNRGIQNVSPWGKSRALIFYFWTFMNYKSTCNTPVPAAVAVIIFFVLVRGFSFSFRFLSLSLVQSLKPVRTILFHDHISFHLLPRQFFVFDPVFFLGVVICLILQVEFSHFCSFTFCTLFSFVFAHFHFNFHLEDALSWIAAQNGIRLK